MRNEYTVPGFKQGRAEQILAGGEALVRVDGEAVLVANAVPGDVIRLQMQTRRRGAQRATMIELVEASPQRVSAPCPVAAHCGGCALQFISAADQAMVKSAWVKDAFKMLIDTQIQWQPVAIQAGHFRRRVRWFVGHDEQGDFLGFYAPASHRAVRHADCIVLAAPLNAVRQLLEAQVDLSMIRSVQAVVLHDGIHIVLETDTCPQPAALAEQGEGLRLQWWWRDAQQITRPLHKPVQQFHDLLPAVDADVLLAVGPDDFVQGQCEGNRALIAQIQAWAGPLQRIADLFCGIGNLSLPLAAASGAELFGAELNAASVRAAARNAKALGLSAQFVVANLFEPFDMEPYIGSDLLILDPPRRGARRICQQISRLLPKKIIMISCDAAAGARDGVILKQQGYRLAALRALDLFPGAGHVEAMSLWERA